MQKEDIRIEKVIIHIMDALVGLPVLSDQEAEFGPDFAEFLQEHICRVITGDDSKVCSFHKEESGVYRCLEEYSEEGFVDMSKDIAGQLYEIMNSNVEIPSGDLIVVRCRAKEQEYLAILKMNFKSSYTHRTRQVEEGNYNEVVKYKSILPGQSQRLTEAAVIELGSYQVHLLEKKYEVNGEKMNYFSELFLGCGGRMSPKTKLSIVTKAVESVQNHGVGEEQICGERMKAKSIIQEELAENGGFVVERLADRIFENQPEMRDQFQEKMEQYNMVKEEVLPKNESTIKKFQSQHLLTDTGIELKIPMDQYKDVRKVEFITEADGSISVLLKNIGHIQAKF